MAEKNPTIQLLPKPTRPDFQDITGRRFGRLVVLGIAERKTRIRWACQCDCGGVAITQRTHLLSGKTTSCGCYTREIFIARKTKHNLANTPLHRAYCDAKGRCENPNHRSYARYGGRGIEFRFESFNHFLETMGEKPFPKAEVDRIDNNGHYEPGNVQWVTRKQNVNNRSNTIRLTIDDITKPLTEWADSTTAASQIRDRIRWGWCHKCAVFGDSCEHRKS